MGGSGSNSSSASGSSTSSNEAKHWVKYHEGADKVWKQVFGEDAFTSLTIAEFVLNNTATSLQDYVKAPKILKGKVNLEMISKWDNLGILVDGPGRCASFAVKVCSRLEKQHANHYDFRYYNIGSHRIARCEKTRVVIDSSSDYGAFQLTLNGEPMWWQGCKHQWEFEAGKGIMQFKKDRLDLNGKTVSSPQIKWNEAIALSANQLATNTKPQLATLFREIVDFSEEEGHTMKTIFRGIEPKYGKQKYRAMLRWDLAKRCLQCWRSLEEQDASSVLIVSWNGKGTQTSEDESMAVFNSFVNKHGVRSQWVTKNVTANQQQMASLEDMHWAVWLTATKLWGHPTSEYVDMSKT